MLSLLREMWITIAEFWSDRRGRRALFAAGGVIASGTVFYRLVEGWSWLDSLYFTVVTLTTVGYGDLSPTSSGSRLFTTVLILVGVSLLLAVLSAIVSRTGERHDEQRDED